MAYKVEFLPEAAREFEKLDGSLRRLAAKQLDKLGARPPNVLLRAGDSLAASGMLAKSLVRRSSATPPRGLSALPLSLRPRRARDGHYSDGLLAERPELGEPLGKRIGIDLTGYCKTYFGKKAYRIVYEVQRERVVVLILGIGKRERAEIYEEGFRRLKTPR